MKGKGDRQPPELFDKPDEVLNRLQQYIADLIKQFRAKPTEAQFQKMIDDWYIQKEYYKRASSHHNNENELNPALINIEKNFAKYYHNVIMPQQQQQPYEVQGGGVIEDITNVAKTVIKKGKKAIEKVKAVVFGTTDLPSKVKTILKKYGDEEIVDAVIKRTPVPKLLTSALSAVSLGAFGKKFKDSPYDKLFHLYIDFTLKSGTHISLEKNEVITMTVNPKDRPKEESQKVSIPANKTLNNILESTEKSMGKQQFIGYSAKDNNCQDFLVAVLKSNSMGDSNALEFVKQDTRQLFEGMDYLRKFANTITDIGARVNVITSGEGIPDSQFFGPNNVKKIDFPKEIKSIDIGYKMKGEGQGEKRKNENTTPPRRVMLPYSVGHRIIMILNEPLNEDTHNEFMRFLYNNEGTNRDSINVLRERFFSWLERTYDDRETRMYREKFESFLRFMDGGRLCGGASVSQMGQAASLRGWVNVKGDYNSLSNIVHSADPYPSANKFADGAMRFDPEAQDTIQKTLIKPQNKAGLELRNAYIEEATNKGKVEPAIEGGRIVPKLKGKYVVQSVLFDKKKWSVTTAKKWLKEKKYLAPAVDKKPNVLRFRQINPEDVEANGYTEYRTKPLGKSGVELVLVYKAGSIAGGAAIQQIGEASLLRSWVGSEDKKILNRIVHSADEDPHSSAGRTGYNEFADVVGYFDPQAQEALQYVIQNPKNKGLRVRDSKVKEAVKQISQYQKPPPKRQGKGIKISTDNKMPKFVKGSQEAKDYMAAMRAKRGTKKGGDLIGDLKAIGSKMGEPFKAIAGANPFEMGYDLGYNVIGPAIAGKGICGACNKEFTPKNMMRHFIKEHTPEEAMKQILVSGERDMLSKYKTSNFGLKANDPRLAPFKAHIEKTINEFNPNMFETAGSGIKKKGKLVKGSQEAKDYMAAMRAKRGKKMKGGDAFTDFFTKTIPAAVTPIFEKKKEEYKKNPENVLADVLQYGSSYAPKIPGTDISPQAAFIRAPGQMRGMGRYMY